MKVKKQSRVLESAKIFFSRKIHFSDLELCRITFFLLVFLTNFSSQHYLVGDFSPSFWSPRPLFQLMSWPQSSSILFAFELVWLISLLFSSIGLFSKTSMFLSAILGTFVLGLSQNFGGLYNDSMITLLCLWIFTFSKAGERLSLDSFLRHQNNSSQKDYSVENNWPIKAAQILTSFAFFSAGYSKIIATGLTWAHPDHFILILKKIDVSYARPFWDNTMSFFLSKTIDSRLLSGFLGHIILYSELLAIFTPFIKALRLTIMPILFFMIISNIHLMGLDFNRFIPVFTFWIPWSQVISRFKQS